MMDSHEALRSAWLCALQKNKIHNTPFSNACPRWVPPMRSYIPIPVTIYAIVALFMTWQAYRLSLCAALSPDFLTDPSPHPTSAPSDSENHHCFQAVQN